MSAFAAYPLSLRMNMRGKAGDDRWETGQQGVRQRGFAGREAEPSAVSESGEPAAGPLRLAVGPMRSCANRGCIAAILAVFS
jgi:hypothetical protein